MKRTLVTGNEKTVFEILFFSGNVWRKLVNLRGHTVTLRIHTTRYKRQGTEFIKVLESAVLTCCSSFVFLCVDLYVTAF